MSTRTDAIQGNLQRIAGKIGENRYLKSVSEGLLLALPVIIIGALSILISNINLEAYQNFITETGLKTVLSLPSSVTISLIALYAVFCIAYRLATLFNQDGVVAGIIALICFLVLTPFATLDDASVIPVQFLGAQGLFVAIIVGLLSARIYVFIVEKGWTIKMPSGVPPTVEKTFGGLLPGIMIVTLFTIISGLFTLTKFESAHEFVYSFIQTPLQNLGGGFWSMVILVIIIHTLWLFGIHGTLAILPILYGVWIPLGLENLDAIAAGNPPENIVNTGFLAVLIIIGGAGATLALTLLLAFFAKSKRYKTLGRLALPPAFFNINEPVIFGLPIVLNPYLAIPFVVAPLTNAIISYSLMKFGVFPLVNGLHMPLGTPVFVNSILAGAVSLILLQVILIIIDILIYLPFFKILDKKALEEEQSNAA
ncbi:PTS sugar transporter subunit IIC [Ornithinibacillus massiliensis]|uniref:Permease IIC component n=1 Tax=Ornithinibacillus massiliensis TaxID=1944633 RepID=A0ABS5MA44_9BACI|nr:PTS transporter subunit EIIC [Ornithinibacillus massiliensis]MBS3678812.1 PTS sugar transporter subunit IIC [Ornithinibacillus massiliensis]